MIQADLCPFRELAEYPSVFIFWNENSGRPIGARFPDFDGMVVSVSDEVPQNSGWVGVGTPKIVPVGTSMDEAKSLALEYPDMFSELAFWNGSAYERLPL